MDWYSLNKVHSVNILKNISMAETPSEPQRRKMVGADDRRGTGGLGGGGLVVCEQSGRNKEVCVCVSEWVNVVDPNLCRLPTQQYNLKKT